MSRFPIPSVRGALSSMLAMVVGLMLVPSTGHAFEVEFLQQTYSGVAGGTVTIAAVASNDDPTLCIEGEPYTYEFYLNGLRVREFSTDATYDLELFILDGSTIVSTLDGPSTNTLRVEARCPEPPMGIGQSDATPGTATLNVANGAVSITSILTDGSTSDAGLSEESSIVFTADWTDADRGFDNHAFSWVIDGGTPYTTEFVNARLDDGPHTVELSINDGEGSIATKTRTIQVANVPPNVSSFSVPTNGAEGAPMLLSVTALDVFDDLEITWTAAGQTYSGRQVNWVPPNQGTWNISVDVDDGTDVVTRSASTSVVNIPPTVANVRRTLPGGGTGSLTEIDEGSTVELAVDVTDPVDTVDVSWLMPDGAELAGENPTWVVGNQSSGNATVLAEDDVDSSSTNAFVRIRNVSPTITGFDLPEVISEGETATLSATAIDPFDALVFEWEVNGQIYVGETVQIPFVDPGTIIVTLSVFDDQVSVSEQLEIEVTNVPPSIEATIDPTDPEEGEEVTIEVTASDVSGSSITYEYEYGDGTAPRTTGQSTVQHTWVDSGTFTLTVSATDNKGGVGTDEVEVVVTNLPPTLTDVFAPGGFEGVPMTFRATGTDPGDDELTFTWDFGDGSDPVTGAEVQHTYADSDTYEVTVTVDDGDGGEDSDTVEVLVRNVPPTLGPLMVSGDVEEEGTVSFSLTATDVADDPLSYEWDFGDGTTDTTDVGEYTYSWPDDGTFVVSVVVRDDEDLASSRQTVLNVVNLAPVITEFYVAEDPPGTPQDPDHQRNVTSGTARSAASRAG